MIKYMVIGDPVAHSRSPGMQNAAFECCGLGSPYGIRQVHSSELESFIEFARQNLLGVNITVPHKAAVIPFLDSIDPEAQVSGSVNTLIIKNGHIHGTSTDGYGIEHALLESFNLSVAGISAVFIGAGGASHATAFHLASRGAKSIRIANRTLARAQELAEKIHHFHTETVTEAIGLDDADTLRRWIAEADVLIQATSLGIKPEDPPPFNLELLNTGSKLHIFDTIYRETPLLKQASKLGIPACGGKLMLIYQGARSFELWTGQTAPLEAMRRGFEEAKPC